MSVQGESSSRSGVSVEELETRRLLAFAGYAVVDIGSLGGGQSSPMGVNNAGQVIGVSLNAQGQPRGFRWTLDGGMIDLGNFSPRSINQAGQIVGTTPASLYYDATETGSVLWQNGVTTPLANPAGYKFAARDINDNGLIVGDGFSTGGGAIQAFKLAGNTFTNLVSGTGGTTGTAEAVNNAGLVAGSLNDHPYVFGGAVSPNLDTNLFGAAYNINDAGLTVGTIAPSGVTDIGVASHSFVANANAANAAMIDLGTLGGPTARLKGLNALGAAVGSSDLAAGSSDTSPIYWSPSTGQVDLTTRYQKPTTAWDFCCGKGINDFGQITGIFRTTGTSGPIKQYFAAPDSAAPTGSLASGPGNVTAASTAARTFTVTYTDDAILDVTTIGAGDVRVTGPGGFNQLATFVSVSNSRDGKTRTATYRLNAPAGGWTSANNGTYSIAVQAGAVLDKTTRPIAAAALGTFAVAIGSTTPVVPRPLIWGVTATPTPVVRGATLTLSGVNPSAAAGHAVGAVEFYLDANGDGVLDRSVDTWIGSDKRAAKGYTLAYDTGGLSTGVHTFFARTRDDVGGVSKAARVAVKVLRGAVTAAVPAAAFVVSPFSIGGTAAGTELRDDVWE